MKLGYVDTSCLVAIAFDEPGSERVADRLRGFDRVFAANLLEAELRAALLREGVTEGAEDLLSWITWLYPNRRLTREFARIAEVARLKGADLWHLASALFLAPEGMELTFLTLDRAQRTAAARLGFEV